MPNYILSPMAVEDLLDIAHYTKRRFGAAQARKYQAQLRKAFEALATGKARSKNVNSVRKMRVVRCQHHFIFCGIVPGQTPEIYAVLHEKMDLMARLAERLEAPGI